jgi:PAS domain-containing protein
MILLTTRNLTKTGLSAAIRMLARRHIQVAASAVASTMASSLSSSSGTLSSASLESDFCHSRHHSTLKTSASSAASSGLVWSPSLQFASPEADFTATRGAHSTTLRQAASGPVWSGSISFASPEANFGSAGLSTMSKGPAGAPEWSQSLSFTSPESDWCANMAPTHQKHDLVGLPETFRDVLMYETDKAIVVTTTEAPYMIVHVNAAWENLCGFTKAEALHGSLSLIQGPESNKARAEEMVQRVVETHQPQDTILVNYSKAGRPFTNHLTIGPLHLESKHSEDKVQFLVGLLEEVPGEGNYSQRRVAA